MASKALSTLTTKLFSEDEEVVVEALTALKEQGDATTVEALLDLLLSDPSYSVTLAITDLLADIKDEASANKFLELFINQKYQAIQHHLLSVLWNSNFAARANAYLYSIVTMGLKGSYQTLLEAFTVIESLEAPFDEEQILESLEACKTFISANAGHEKLPLVKELADLLTEMDNNNSDISPEEI